MTTQVALPPWTLSLLISGFLIFLYEYLYTLGLQMYKRTLRGKFNDCYEEVYSPRRQYTISTMTINEHAKTDMYIEHYIKY